MPVDPGVGGVWCRLEWKGSGVGWSGRGVVCAGVSRWRRVGGV